MSSRRVVVDASTGASMSLQRHRASFRGTRLLSSLDSPPASRTSAIGGLVRAPRVSVGMAPSGYTGGLVARVTRRALGISSIFLQGLQSSGLAVAPAPSLERDLGAVEDLGGCLVEYMAKVHALEQAIQDLEAQLRMHLESKAGRRENWGALRASWASSCQQVSARAVPKGSAEGEGWDADSCLLRVSGRSSSENTRAEAGAGVRGQARETDYNPPAFMLHTRRTVVTVVTTAVDRGVLGARPT